MSDDLVKRLGRLALVAETANHGTDEHRLMPAAGVADIVYEAKDRIEELEAENRLLRDAVYIDDLTVTMQADDRSKAMVAMKRALDFLNADMPTEAKTALRATLAELTGGNDE